MLAAVLVVMSGCSAASGSPALHVGAIYPTGGGQGEGGLEEWHGVQLAAELANRRHLVDGGIQLDLAPVSSAEGAPAAVRSVFAKGARIVLGTYGSTISRKVAEVASSKGMLFWETGAVGQLMTEVPLAGDRVFRFAPTGQTLGTSAIDFIEKVVKPKLGEQNLNYSIAYVDDVYGRSVGLGAEARAKEIGIEPTMFPYDASLKDFAPLARAVAAAHTDVLVVSAYLRDGVSLRKALVDERVPLRASIGTSSSYCMEDFGRQLGPRAVGLFASDKPDAGALDAARLSRPAADAFRFASKEYRERWHEPMPAPALAGFSAAWALFDHVIPAAKSMRPAQVARAAMSMDLPIGSLPNAAGMRFVRGDSGSLVNVDATHVIWEWVKPNTRAVVWPPEFAKHDVTVLPI
ncbi:MAG: ABC transporter substrate-binding protein [Actinobacteria bacterium]|nr:ABC transporter substrate-binding protein [Actinomycetota bacterium]